MKHQMQLERERKYNQALHEAEVAAYTTPSRKCEIQADRTLQKYFRMEQLWDIFKEHAWEVGRAAVAARRSLAGNTGI